MSLVTLSGTISAADLNNNFQDKVDELNTSFGSEAKHYQYDVDCRDLTSATEARDRRLRFTPPQLMLLSTLGLSVFNPDATSRTITIALQAVDTLTGVVIPKYLLHRTISIYVTASTAAEYNATRYAASGLMIPLFRGVVYELLLSSASASAVDRAYGMVVCSTPRRKV